MSIEWTLYLTWKQPLSLNFAAATPVIELGKVTQLTTLISVCATLKSLRDQYRKKGKYFDGRLDLHGNDF